MGNPWLHIIGIGADGAEGLTPATRAILDAAEVVIGATRHHEMLPDLRGERVFWPSPFDALLSTLKGLRGRRVVVLATGDPLWYSVGARIGRELDRDEITYHPHVSAFQLAACRLGWSLADVETLTVHGRRVEQIIPFIQPHARLLILTTGGETPNMIASILRDRGFGPSRMTVLSNMGGADEGRFTGLAQDWSQDIPAFNTLAVDCVAGNDALILPHTPGLPDGVFRSDGKMTKQEVRSVTLSKLMPMRGGVLWDVGSGCGSVAIEWMRAARDAHAIGIEPRADRRAIAALNAEELGTPGLNLIDGTAPDVLENLPSPDAVFIGGGLSDQVFETCWAALPLHGRLVANAVTLESEAVLIHLHARFGGDLIKLSVQRAEPIGGLHGWRPMMPVTQWSLIKR